jgi:hypothetical protein
MGVAMLVISCHADTCQISHWCEKRGGRFRGYLDNFAGVHAVASAYFSGRWKGRHLRVEFTHGEERGMLGAREVRRTLRPHDTVAVVDVTGAATRADFTVEKCADPSLAAFLGRALGGMRYELFSGCPDPVSDSDETDVYRTRCRRVFFVGIPVAGGDYNEKPVTCRASSLSAVTEALCRIAAAYPSHCRGEGIPAV